jgi:hypothetical protein
MSMLVAGDRGKSGNSVTIEGGDAYCVRDILTLGLGVKIHEKRYLNISVKGIGSSIGTGLGDDLFLMKEM